MKTKTRLAFFLSILMAASFMTACSFSSSSDNDDDDSNNTSQPDKTVTNVPRTLKIVQLPCDNGIAIAVRKLDGTPFVVPQSGENNTYGGRNDNYLVIDLDNGLYSNFAMPEKWICPYVNPNEPVTLHVKLTCEMFDANKIKKEVKDLAWDEITITPTTGFGRVTYDGKVNIEFNKSGDLKVTADSQTLKNYRGDYWNVVTDISTGKDWESLGSWMSNMYVRNDQFGQTFNLWMNSSFHHQILENGLTLGFLDSYIEYTYKVSDNESYSYKTKNAEGLGYRKGITLDSFESYLQSQGLANPFTRAFADKFGTVVNFYTGNGSLDKNSKGETVIYYSCTIECSELTQAFKNLLNNNTWYTDSDVSYYPNRPSNGDISNNHYVFVSCETHTNSKMDYSIYYLEAGKEYGTQDCIKYSRNIDLSGL